MSRSRVQPGRAVYRLRDGVLVRVDVAGAAAPARDTEPPTDVATVTASGVDQDSGVLQWTAATDNVGVVRYTVTGGKVGQPAVPVGEVQAPLTTLTVQNLDPASQYEFAVLAHDAAGLYSANAATVRFTTLAAPNPVGPAPVLLSAVEPVDEPRVSVVTRNAVEAGYVWDLYETGSEANGPVATGLTGTERRSGPVMIPGRTLNYYAYNRRLSDGALSARSNTVSVTIRDTTQPDPDPGPSVSPQIAALRTELAKAATQPITGVGLGSSTTAGFNATANATRYWTILTRNIQQRYAPSVPASSVQYSITSQWGTTHTGPGFHGYSGAQGGTDARDYVLPAHMDRICALPGLKFRLHMVGSNDYDRGIALTAYQAELQEKLDDAKAQDAIAGITVLDIYVHAYARTDGGTHVATWAQYGAALQSFAEANAGTRGGTAFYDLSPYYDGRLGTPPAGWMDTDRIHQTDIGHAYMAQLLTDWLIGSTAVVSFNAAQQQVMEVRDQYPGANPLFAHLPPAVRWNARYEFWELIPAEEGGWRRIYWVPPGSTFAAPNGEYVHRSRTINPASGTLATAVGPDKVAVVICPEKFENQRSGTDVQNFRGVIFQGHHVGNTQWLGRTDIPVYGSRSDAETRTNGQTVRPGFWYYNPTNITGAPRIDSNPDGTGNVHRQSTYAKNYAGIADPDPGKDQFTAFEGFYDEGDWTPEGFNWTWAGVTPNAMLLLAAFRKDRVSVYYKRVTATDYSSKVPGGDGGQFFGNLTRLVVSGYTVAATPLQAMFIQMNQNGAKPKQVHVRHMNSRAQTGAGFGPNSGGNQWYMTWSRLNDYLQPGEEVDYDFEDITVWREGASRAQLIHDQAEFPEVVVMDRPDVVPASLVGVRYVSPEAAISGA